MSAKMFKLSTPSAPRVETHQYLPWVEKYRPKTVDDVSHQEEVINTLKKSIESRNLPHLLFYGPPGTGKTSTILAIAHQLYGPEHYKLRVMELNASDERGINVIRSKVKAFAQVATTGSANLPPYKLIILDEADAMTADAQAALRRTMETYSRNTRFCLICNYVSRIIEPLASRCAKFRFKPLGSESMHNRIQHICQQEGVPYSKELVEALGEVSGGDLRKAITFLQSAFTLYAEETDAASIIEIAGKVPVAVVEALVHATRTNSFEQLQQAVNNHVVAEGYPVSQILSQLFDAILADPGLADVQKAMVAEELAAADKALQDGADEFLQLMSVLSFLMNQRNQY